MKNEVVVLLLLINCHRCKTKKKKANSIRCILSSSLDVTINVQSTDDFTFFFLNRLFFFSFWKNKIECCNVVRSIFCANRGCLYEEFRNRNSFPFRPNYMIENFHLRNRVLYRFSFPGRIL